MSLLHTVPDRLQGATEESNEDSNRTGNRRAGGEPPTPTENPGPGSGGLTRVTANFTPRAIASLDRIAAQTGDSKTDILNRSVMFYEVCLELIERSGDGTLTVLFPDGVKERLRFLG